MSKEEIISGNKLIAEFMGYKFNAYVNLKHDNITKPNESEWYYASWDVDEFNEKLEKLIPYHSSWDWLMPVVEKIFNLYEWDDFIYNPKKCLFYLTTKIKIYAGSTDTDEGTCGEMIYKYIKSDKPLYDAVVEFIKWYNQQSK